jgi:hypothetical protein
MAVDMINLLAFVNSPPTAKLNRSFDPKEIMAKVNQVHEILNQLMADGMSADDLMAKFICRRVSPL